MKANKDTQVILLGYRRRAAVCFATNKIAELVEDKEIDRMIVKKFRCSKLTARKIRHDAWALILKSEESNRGERFRSMVLALRHLCATAYDQRKLSVCANALAQLRVMFGLDQPYIETGGSKTSNNSERSTEDLLQFAEHGTWPEEAVEKERKANVSPLDNLV